MEPGDDDDDDDDNDGEEEDWVEVYLRQRGRERSDHAASNIAGVTARALYS